MRRLAWFSVAIPTAAACALVFPYGDYELDSRDGSVDGAHKGGTAGLIGDAKFGGGSGGAVGGSAGATGGTTPITGGAAGSSGGTVSSGGAAGSTGGAAGSSGGTVSSGGASGTGGTIASGGGGGTGGVANECSGKGDGTPCGPATSCSGNVLNYSQCIAGKCQAQTQGCGQFACKNGGCLTSCSTEADCNPPNKCAGGQCIDCVLCGSKFGSSTTKPLCPSDSQTLWDNLKDCCTSKCWSTCSYLEVCGGSTSPSNPCYYCLSNNCPIDTSACTGDFIE